MYIYVMFFGSDTVGVHAYNNNHAVANDITSMNINDRTDDNKKKEKKNNTCDKHNSRS